MIQFICDLCGKEMAAHDRERYVARLVIRPAHPLGELTEDDLDDDNLERVSEILRNAEDSGAEIDLEPTRVTSRHDLCSACRDKVIRNPFNARSVTTLACEAN